jgi:hypothetical protein
LRPVLEGISMNTAEDYRAASERCCRLAEGTTDRAMAQALRSLAAEYRERAAQAGGAVSEAIEFEGCAPQAH